MDKNKTVNLMTKVRGGDMDALREFYDTYAGKIMTAAVYMTKDFNVAEDVVSIVMEQCWHDDYSNTDNINKLIWQLTKFAVSDFFKYRETRKNTNKPEREIAAATNISKQHAELKELLWQFEEHDRNILLLYIVFELGFADIANELGLSVYEVQERYKNIIVLVNNKIKTEGCS